MWLAYGCGALSVIVIEAVALFVLFRKGLFK